jgi:23S rRNA (guanine745-N1)-methyltransferase
MSKDPGSLALAGFDVSKWAIKSAARRKTPVAWLVANNSNPPFLPWSVDLILCLFGFPVWGGFKKVQKPGGCVLLVEPAADHLVELRSVIYRTVNRSPPPALAVAQAAGYRLMREEALRYRVTLRGTDTIQDLLAMTPHAHRVAPDRRDALAALGTLSVTVDVAFRLLQLDPPQ